MNYHVLKFHRVDLISMSLPTCHCKSWNGLDLRFACMPCGRLLRVFGKGFSSSASILNFMLAPRIAPWETGVHGTFAACLVALAQLPGSEVLLNRWSRVSNDQCWMLKPLCNVCITLTVLLCYCRCNRDKGNLLVFIAVGNFRCLSPVSNYSSFITSR